MSWPARDAFHNLECPAIDATFGDINNFNNSAIDSSVQGYGGSSLDGDAQGARAYFHGQLESSSGRSTNGGFFQTDNLAAASDEARRDENVLQ